MDLLILKHDDQYIRFKDGEYLLVNIDKASVFPLGQLERVKNHEKELVRQGFINVQIKRLVLTEKDFES